MVLRCDFRVLEGQDYQFIMGLDLMKLLKAWIHVDAHELLVLRGNAGEVKKRITIPLYERNTIRVQPTVRKFRNYLHASAQKEPLQQHKADPLENAPEYT